MCRRWFSRDVRLTEEFKNKCTALEIENDCKRVNAAKAGSAQLNKDTALLRSQKLSRTCCDTVGVCVLRAVSQGIPTSLCFYSFSVSRSHKAGLRAVPISVLFCGLGRVHKGSFCLAVPYHLDMRSVDPHFSAVKTMCSGRRKECSDASQEEKHEGYVKHFA